MAARATPATTAEVKKVAALIRILMDTSAALLRLRPLAEVPVAFLYIGT